jgi:hypoxanthine phosphoribosyltransferase
VRTLLTEVQLRDGVVRLAREINAAYEDHPLTIVSVLTGSVVLLADLIRLLNMPLRVGVLQASSYREGTSRGALIVNSEMMLDVADRDVLLVDDIFDTGHTLIEVIAALQDFKPKSVRSAVLLRKAERQEVDLIPDFIGFEIPNEFVVGYGLDYRDLYRNLPFLAALEPADLDEDHV